MSGCAPTFTVALAVALAACTGTDAGEDAPDLPSTGIPTAAPNASGVQLDMPATALGTTPHLVMPPHDPEPPADPFETPEPLDPTPPPAVPNSPLSKGMQL